MPPEAVMTVRCLDCRRADLCPPSPGVGYCICRAGGPGGWPLKKRVCEGFRQRTTEIPAPQPPRRAVKPWDILEFE